MTRPTFEDGPDWHPDSPGVTELFGGMVVHRGYDRERDGWMQHQIRPGEYPVVDQAQQVLDMAAEIDFLRRRVWQLEQAEKKYQNLMFGKAGTLDG